MHKARKISSQYCPADNCFNYFPTNSIYPSLMVIQSCLKRTKDHRLQSSFTNKTHQLFPCRGR